MKENIVLIIAYDGSDYFGWQKTPFGPTIESTLEEALSPILGWRPELQAASRTDRGVHAHNQVVNFLQEPSSLSLETLQLALNHHLPPTIRVKEIFKAPLEFHPSLNTLAKEYHYLISTERLHSPFMLTTSWHCPFPLDVALMRQEALALIGTHDFKAFSNVQPHQREETHREVTKVSLVSEKNYLRIEIKANRFLYKMARNIVGTLVHIGCGKIATPLQELIARGDRAQLGMTAPPQGLFLHAIDYPPDLYNQIPLR
jgi:tRNA pseudouridine38-40 synthase